METSFEELKKIWYQKLKESGWVDCEDTSKPDQPLKDWHSLKWRKKTSPNKLNLKRDYYIKASQLVQSYVFVSEIEKLIWSLHSEGFSKRKIEAYLIKNKIEPSYKREQIGKIIKLIASSIL